MAIETEILKQFYAALNRNDVPGVLKLCDPGILRVEFEGSPGGGTYRGLAEFKAHVEKGRGTWAEGSCTPERFVGAGNKVVVLVFVRVRLKEKTDWNEGRVADAFAFRDDKITEFRSFFENERAFEWAGIKDPGKLSSSAGD